MRGDPTINIAIGAGVLVVVATLRLLADRAGRGAPATGEDLDAIKAALASEGGRVVRANRDRSGSFFAKNEYLDQRADGRLYHVTLRVGAVTVRRRVAVRSGHPAQVLP
jgi:hypothetical protein